MTNLPDFGSVLSCPKCDRFRSQIATTSVAETNNSCGFKVEHYVRRKYETLMVSTIIGDFLSITCDQCGYSWDEQCADAPKEPVEEMKSGDILVCHDTNSRFYGRWKVSKDAQSIILISNCPDGEPKEK